MALSEEWTLHTGAQTYFTAPLFDRAGVRHLFATRKGGVSRGCFSDWNFAVGTGTETDSEDAVLQNYAIAAELLGCKGTDVCRTYQTHTAKVIFVGNAERGTGIDRPKFDFGVDGLVSGTKDLVLSVRAADCVPILLYDPEGKLCAAVHSGWRGTFAGIVCNAVTEMKNHGSDPENILAAIGPCIGADCYEVGSDLYSAAERSGRALTPFFRKTTPKNGEEKYLLDLVSINEALLMQSGLSESHITSARICTHCHPEWFFSHRVMGANRGTMSAFITV